VLIKINSFFSNIHHSQIEHKYITYIFRHLSYHFFGIRFLTIMFMSSAFYSALILWQPLFFSVFCVDRGFHSDTCFSCHSPGSQSPEKMKTHRGYLPRLYRQMYTSYMDCGDHWVHF